MIDLDNNLLVDSLNALVILYISYVIFSLVWDV